MSRPIFVVIGATFLLGCPVVLLLIGHTWLPLDLQDLSHREQGVVGAISRLGINVGVNDRFPCNFGVRGHFFIETDRKGSVPQVVEFDLIPSCCVPVGIPQDISESTMDKLVDELSRFAHLRRAVLPNARDDQAKRLQAQMPQCEIFTRLSDARFYSSEVVFTEGSPASVGRAVSKSTVVP